MFYNFHGRVSNSKDKEKLFIASNKTTPLQYVQVYFWAFKSGHMEMLKTLLLNVAIRLNSIMFISPPPQKKKTLSIKGYRYLILSSKCEDKYERHGIF